MKVWKMQAATEYFENEENYLIHNELCCANRKKKLTEEEHVRCEDAVSLCLEDIKITQWNCIQRLSVSSRFMH